MSDNCDSCPVEDCLIVYEERENECPCKDCLLKVVCIYNPCEKLDDLIIEIYTKRDSLLQFGGPDIYHESRIKGI
jgi:hypothetical protein